MMVFSKKAQASFEFMAVVFIVMAVTTILAVIAGEKLSEMRIKQDIILMEEVALTLKNEIDIAHSMQPGYVRKFEIPFTFGRKNYSISLQDNVVAVSLDDRNFWMSVQPVTGTVQKGKNTIEKFNTTVVLND